MNFREDIKAYIDGELTEARAAEVRSAIDADPALREEYEFMKGLSSQIQSSAKSAPVLGYEKVKAAVAGKRRFKVRWVEGLVAAAAVTILGVVMYPVFSQSPAASQMTVTTMGGGADAAEESDLEGMIDLHGLVLLGLRCRAEWRSGSVDYTPHSRGRWRTHTKPSRNRGSTLSSTRGVVSNCVPYRRPGSEACSEPSPLISKALRKQDHQGKDRIKVHVAAGLNVHRTDLDGCNARSKARNIAFLGD